MGMDTTCGKSPMPFLSLLLVCHFFPSLPAGYALACRARYVPPRWSVDAVVLGGRHSGVGVRPFRAGVLGRVSGAFRAEIPSI